MKYMTILLKVLGFLSNKVEQKSGTDRICDIVAEVQSTERDLETGIIALNEEQDIDNRLLEDMKRKISARSKTIAIAEKMLGQIKEVSNI